VVYADKVECLTELQLLESQGYIDIYYGDESGFSLNCVIPYCWQFKGEPVLILPQRGKTSNVLGFMKSSGDAVRVFTKEGTINAVFVIDSIHNFADSLTKTTVLILDNARIHHAKLFQSCIAGWEAKGLYIFYLPAYSPHLNRIEQLWRESKYRWIPPSAYADLTTLREKLDQIWAKFGKDYKISFSSLKS
jgi:transposase